MGCTAWVAEAFVVKGSGVVVGAAFSVAGSAENTGIVVGFSAVVA